MNVAALVQALVTEYGHIVPRKTNLEFVSCLPYLHCRAGPLIYKQFCDVQ